MERSIRAKIDKLKIKQIVLLGLLSASWALLIAVFVTGHFWDLENIHQNLSSLRVWTSLNRAYILFFVLFYIGLHFMIPIKKMYSWLFEKRWVVAFFVLIFLTINRYHGDSISYYADAIQPGVGSASSYPIIGEERDIRSDEFIGTTPSILASGYGDEPYGKYNEILRGTKSLNIINGVYLGYSTLAYAPWYFVYAILPVEYAFSFCWYTPIILCFLMSIELFYIISKKKKLLSVAGAFLVVFSSFYMWWTFSIRIAATAGTIVCLYYFIHCKENWKRVLLGGGTAICFANFIITLYPAWQVPFGYMYLAIGIWLVHDNWDKIKRFEKKEWAILGVSIVFCLSLVASYFVGIAEYTESISSTVYPGLRREYGGGALYKIFWYAQAPFYAFKDIGNASEAGVFFSLFPIPSIMALYCWIKEKKKDWLTGGLLIVQIPMLFYVTTGLPKTIASLLLFSNATPSRVIDVIGLIQIFLIIILMSRYSTIKRVPGFVGILGGGITAGICLWVSEITYPGYLGSGEKVIMFIIITFLGFSLIYGVKNKVSNVVLYTFIGVSVFTSFYVRPIMKGLDAIYSKPVAAEIQKICNENENEKWITKGLGLTLPAYSVSCGASTINSVNLYPNMELWKKLDPEKKYEDIYNRFAHINVSFTKKDTWFEAISGDYIEIHLSYKDIEKTEASYLLVGGEEEIDFDNGYVKFEKQYQENGISIFKLSYF